MADNIINPNDMTGKGTGSGNDFVMPEQPDEALTERFTGLMSGESEESLSDQDKGSSAPVQFSDLDQDGNAFPPLSSPEGAEQADFNAATATEQENLEEGIRGTAELMSSGNSSVLGENIESLPATGTLGDKILQGMQNIRERVENGARQVESNLDPARETMSMREMFETQWTMSNLMITEDYIGKVVSKGTQAFDTLLRNQ